MLRKHTLGFTLLSILVLSSICTIIISMLLCQVILQQKIVHNYNQAWFRILKDTNLADRANN